MLTLIVDAPDADVSIDHALTKPLNSGSSLLTTDPVSLAEMVTNDPSRLGFDRNIGTPATPC